MKKTTVTLSPPVRLGGAVTSSTRGDARGRGYANTQKPGT